MTLEYDILSAKIKLAQKNHHHIIHWAQNGVYHEAIETEIITKGNKRFAKIWLLEAQHVNGNGWGVHEATLAENMPKFHGRPYVVTAKSFIEKDSIYGEQFVHPNIPTNDVRRVIQHQERFRVGTIVDTLQEGHNWFAMVEILPKFAGKSLPPFCSPAVYQLDAREDPRNFRKWEALHLAGLMEKPAYGARLATLRGTCIGTKNECKVQFTKVAQLDGTIMCAKMQKANSYKADKLKVSMKLAQIRLGAEFNEKDHPRSKDGEFTSGSGGDKTKGTAFERGNAASKGPSNLTNDVSKQQKEFDSALDDYVKSLKGEHASPSLNESHFREVFRGRAVTMGNRVKKSTGEFPEGFDAVKTKPKDLSNVVGNIGRMSNAENESDETVISRLRARGFGKKESTEGLKLFRETE